MPSEAGHECQGRTGLLLAIQLSACLGQRLAIVSKQINMQLFFRIFTFVYCALGKQRCRQHELYAACVPSVAHCLDRSAE